MKRAFCQVKSLFSFLFFSPGTGSQLNVDGYGDCIGEFGDSARLSVEQIFKEMKKGFYGFFFLDSRFILIARLNELQRRGFSEKMDGIWSRAVIGAYR